MVLEHFNFNGVISCVFPFYLKFTDSYLQSRVVRPIRHVVHVLEDSLNCLFSLLTTKICYFGCGLSINFR